MNKETNPAHSERILVVDDATANLQLLTDLLTAHGYIVHPASDGELALEFVRTTLPDLILLDIRMPGMDGYEVCRRLKADERTRSIPLIFISILEDEFDKVKGFQEGAVDYITKPLQPDEVLARVRTHLRIRMLTEHLEHKVAERTEELTNAKEQLQQELAERKRVEQERLAHLRFFECMDQINRVMQGTNDLEQMMRDVLDVVLSIFECDQAFLMYPCDPDAPTWRLPMERNRPEYPPILEPGFEMSMDADVAEMLRLLLAADGPVKFGPGTPYSLPPEIAEPFGFKCFMSMALHTQVGKPWQIGICQCSRVRRWTPEEERLFREIGRRLGDVLAGLLANRDLKESERRYWMVFENSPVSIWEEDFSEVKIFLNDLKKKGIVDIEAYFTQHPEAIRECAELVKIVDVNRATLALHSASNKEELLAGLVNTFTPESFDTFRQELVGLWNGETEMTRDAVVKTLAGASRHVTVSFSVCPGYEETLSKVLVSLINITERKQAERSLEESEAKSRSILDNIGIGVTLISPEMEILELNKQMRERFPAIDPEQRPICYQAFHESSREGECDYCPTYKTLQDGLVHEATMQAVQAGSILDYRIVSSPVMDPSGQVTAAIEMVEDITEKVALESQLRQAQKMESVGRLAGGIAHDFNNMLSIILGYVEMAMADIDQAQPIFHDLQKVYKAAERSSNLTRQLLAFARRQAIAPKVLDLNETVESMLKLLRRLIGEDINLVWMPDQELWPIKVDPSQIDQILANLCINSRDAIAGVGKVTIETKNAAFDEAYCADHLDSTPGEYVLLSVSDDGCGMERETLNKIFEPFFTTKDSGEGTGLGLATVYGIVRQNNGFLNVYSEPGHGTAFKIYLPRHGAWTEQMRKEIPSVPTARGHETILLVEDESTILNMVKLMLETLGYRVLAFSTPGEAIRFAREQSDEIHLLITDVVMPEMNGLDLWKQLDILFTGLRCLFMSGYTGNVIVRHGVLDEGVNFIQKPFSKQSLAAKVREVLDSE